MNTNMQEYMFPVVLILIGFVIFSIFKPSEYLTFMNEEYLNHLEHCTPYTAKGKVISLGNTSSISKIIGVKNGKCEIETINTYKIGKPTASMCLLNKSQLDGLLAARRSHTFVGYAFDDALYVEKLTKEGVCTSYNLINNKWEKKR